MNYQRSQTPFLGITDRGVSIVLCGGGGAWVEGDNLNTRIYIVASSPTW